MKKNLIILLIMVASVSMAGVLITQFFWMKSAVLQKQDQDNHRLIMALQRTRDHLVDNRNIIPDYCFNLSEGTAAAREKKAAFEQYYDSLLKANLHVMGLRLSYQSAILDAASQKIMFGNAAIDPVKLQTSGLRFSFECPDSGNQLTLVVFVMHQPLKELSKISGILILTALLIGVLIFAFFYVVSLLYKQKHLSDMKTDFVNNMTHEFKTPIATISIATEMLMKGDVYSDLDKTKRYSKIIYDENLRLMHQVEQVLQIALIDKDEFKLRFRDVSVHEIIRNCIISAELIVKQRGGEIKYNLDAINDHIIADPIHLTNVINNLLDNANKYTPSTPIISVNTSNTGDGIVISVADNGIGISQENQKLVFKRFYRVPTGNVHDVKGFGLGLFYVKKIIDSHGGYISLYSELGKGTRMEVFLPFINNLN